MAGIWQFHQQGVLIFFALISVLTLINLLSLRKLHRNPRPAQQVRVSVLIPARNEAQNISACLTSILAQHYPDLQVIVLDDHSTDQTWALVSQLAEKDDRLLAMRGAELPEGWLGKHWACQQMAEAASGELLLFIDADVRLHPNAVGDAVACQQKTRADLLTAFPRQTVQTWAEKLVVPMFEWALVSFVPLALAEHSKAPWMGFAIGQFMLFPRPAYQAIGGHAAIRADVVDDIALCRAIKAADLRWRLADGTQRVTCRMYHNYEQVREGFSKNLFAAFGYNKLVFGFIWLWLFLAYFVPPLGLVWWALGLPLPGFLPAVTACSVLLAAVQVSFVYARLKFPPLLALLYPATIATSVYIAFRSMLLTARGEANWKGRQVAPNKDP